MQLIKNYIADCDIPRNSLVKFSASENHITLATAGTDNVIGAVDEKDYKTGDMVNVIHLGIGEVKCSGSISAGATFTSTAKGQAAATTNGNNSVGILLRNASANDIVPALINPIRFIPAVS